MRKAKLFMHGQLAAFLTEFDDGHFEVAYHPAYEGPPVSLTLPVSEGKRKFSDFPPFLDGLLLEGVMLEAFLQRYKIDKNDRFSQIIRLGEDLVGALTVQKVSKEDDGGNE